VGALNADPLARHLTTTSSAIALSDCTRAPTVSRLLHRAHTARHFSGLVQLVDQFLHIILA